MIDDRDIEQLTNTVRQKWLAREREVTRREPEPPLDGDRQAFRVGSRSYHLSPRETALLTDIGRFRVVCERDVLRFIYGGDKGAFAHAISHLERAGLVRSSACGRMVHYLALTIGAKYLVDRHLLTNPEQRSYAKVKKPGELAHDAALYRLYKKKEAELAARGWRVTRVVLDYELKSAVFNRTAKKSRKSSDYDTERERAARECRVPIVQGKLVFPDLRIEYEREDGGRDSVDLEYVTGNYRERSIASKRAAGFELYREKSGGRIGFDPDYAEELISL